MSKLKIAVLVSGSGSNLQALIDAVKRGIIKGRIEIVISDRSGAYALQRADKAGITSVCIDKSTCLNKADFDNKILERLDMVKPDLIILAGYLSILSTELVLKYQHKIINVHPSLLPAFGGKGFYGEKVHKAVIEYGSKVSGATVHFVDENTDTGPIILQKAVVVLYGDTPESLGKRILAVEHSLIVKAAELFCNHKLMVEGRKVRILREC